MNALHERPLSSLQALKDAKEDFEKDYLIGLIRQSRKKGDVRAERAKLLGRKHTLTLF
jgi:hypothetical protein